ncbi:hypothetical protein K8T06_12185, partial [bacterium]|nr:hypothetical protein [bacterium]
MKNCSFYAITLLLIPILLVSLPVSASDSLEAFLDKGAFVCRWEPLITSNNHSCKAILSSDQNLEIILKKGSGLRIEQNNLSNDEIIVRQKFSSVSDPQIFTLVPLEITEYVTSSNRTIEIPSSVTDDIVLVLSSSTADIPVQLFHYTSVHRPFFWGKIQTVSTKLLDKNLFISEFHNIYEKVESSDDWSLTGLWVRMLAPAVPASQNADDPSSFLRDAIYDITTAFAVLSGENTQETELETDGTNLSVTGPAMLKCWIQAVLDDICDSGLTEIPLSLRIDGVRTGHWPDGICPVIRGHDFPSYKSNSKLMSLPVYQTVFIPRGTHTLSFDSDRHLLLNIRMVQPVFQRHSFKHLPYPTRFFSQIPITRLNDIGWVQHQFLKNGENPILQNAGNHYNNRVYWHNIDPKISSEWYLDPSETGKLYPLESDTTANLIVADLPEKPGSIRFIHINDPDRQPGDQAPEILLDGHSISIPVLQNPYETPLQFGLALFPGIHEVEINSFGRQLLVNEPLENVKPMPLTNRQYFPISHSESQPTSFFVSGNTNSAQCQIYFRTAGSAPIDVRLNNKSWKSMLPEHPSNKSIRVYGPVELTVPQGDYSLSFHSDNPDLLVSVYQPRWLTDPAKTSLTKDPFLELLIHNMNLPATQDKLLEKLSVSDPGTPEKILWLSLAGDHLRARNLFMDTTYDESLVSHRMLLAWLYAHTGFAARALDTAWLLIEDETIPCCNEFLQVMLDAALTLGNQYRSAVIAEVMIQNGSTNLMAQQVINNIKNHTDIPDKISLEQLARSQSPRFLSIPDSEI